MTAKKNPRPSVNPVFSVGNEEQYREPDLQARLVGVVYDVYLPKSASALALAKSVKKDKKGRVKVDGEDAAVIDALLEWVDGAFGDDQAKEIRKRLQDPKDRLDIEHVSEFMQKLVEYQTEDSENPTT